MTPFADKSQNCDVVLRGARYASSAQESRAASLHIADGRIARIVEDRDSGVRGTIVSEVDLSGFLILPGLINAHDHLQFSLFPRLANPPYLNYVDWGEDIHRSFPAVIARHRAVPSHLRLWWGGIRNLLCGVTTVCHHDELYPELRREDFPVRVVQEYGWAHSFALGGNLRAARAAAAKGRPFIMHACEGVDEFARDELIGIERLGLLDEDTVLVHGLAIDGAGVELMIERRASLIACPSSNRFLFGRLPDLSLLGAIDHLALGNDSPLTAMGDLLDEVRFAIHHCGITAQAAFRMVTEAPARILRLNEGMGSIVESGAADVVAIRDLGRSASEMLPTLAMSDIELVMIGGRVQLASDDMLERLPKEVTYGLEPLFIDGVMRWLRAPIAEMLKATEEVLGAGEVRVSGHLLGISTMAHMV